MTLPDRIVILVRQVVASLGILTFHEYRVVDQAGPLVNLQAVRKAAGLPDLARCAARPGAAGSSATYTPGSLVLVGFVEADPSRPFLAFGGEVGGPGTVPITAALDATATTTIGSSSSDVLLGAGVATVIRAGDTISISPGNGGGPVSGIVALTPGIPPTPPSKVKA